MQFSPKTRYLIIGYSRSGTTVIHLALMGHPNISALVGELRPIPFFFQGIKTFTGGYSTDKESELGFGAIFNAITSIHADENTSVVGAKTACNSPKTARKIVNVLQENLKDLKVIHIVRKDLVSQFGSSLSAEKSGVMHSWSKGAETSKRGRVRIGKMSFINYLIENFRMYSELLELRKSHEVYELNYEDYVKDPNVVHQELFNFVGVPGVEVTWLKSKKVMPSPQDYILNYDDMQKVLLDTKEKFFNNTLSPMNIYIPRIYARCKKILRF